MTDAATMLERDLPEPDAAGDVAERRGRHGRRTHLRMLSRIDVLLPVFGLALVALLWWAALDDLDKEQRVFANAAAVESANLVATFEQRTLRAIQDADRTTLLMKYLFERDGSVDVPEIMRMGLIPRDRYLLTGMVDRTGRVIASSEQLALGRVMADRDYFKRHAARDTGTLDISAPTVLRTSGKLAIQLTRRLNARDGTFAGMILLSVDPEFFTAWYDDARLGNEGMLALIGTDGIVRAQRVGHERAAAFDGMGDRVLAAAAREPAGSYQARGGSDQVERLFAYRRVASLPLLVVAGQAKSDVFARYETDRRAHLAVASAATVLIVGFFGATTLLALRLKQSRERAWARAGELRLASTVFETTADAVVLTDADDRIVMLNPACTRLTGYTAAELIGIPFAQSPLGAGDTPDGETLRSRAVYAEHALAEVARRTSEGKTLHLRKSVSCVRDERGTPVNYVRVFTDISALKHAQRKLEQLARSDPLTGLPNRRAFHDILHRALARAERMHQSTSLLFIDLDGFKVLNDSLGHDAGDEALRQVASRLSACLRDGDTLCRLGGDEFTVIIEGAAGPDSMIRAAERVLEAFDRDFEVGGRSVRLSASIGAAQFPLHAACADALISEADAAMYRAKQWGGRALRLAETHDALTSRTRASEPTLDAARESLATVDHEGGR